jgi:hypothetical protein
MLISFLSASGRYLGRWFHAGSRAAVTAAAHESPWYEWEEFIDPFDVQEPAQVDQPFTTSTPARVDQPWGDIEDLAMGSRDRSTPPFTPGAEPAETRKSDRISPLWLKGRGDARGQDIPRGDFRNPR